MCTTYLCLLLLHLCIAIVSGLQQFCKESSDCKMRVGETCQNSECVCLQSTDISLQRPCPQVQIFGKKCTSDIDCGMDLICDKLDTCKCHRGHNWNTASNRCYLSDEDPYTNKGYDVIRDGVIPSIILMSLAITASLSYRLYRTRKSWQQRRSNDMARALEEAQLPIVGNSQPPATWIASYRVFGTVERSGPPCLLLPVGPPPYEEALKHKVILSSYQPPLAHTTPL